MSYNSSSHAQVCDTTTQTIAVANTPQAVTFNTNVFLRKIAHSTSVNKSRITVNEAGQYDVIAIIQTTSSAANKTLDFWFRVNGTDVTNSNCKSVIENSGQTDISVVGFCFPMTAGQYFELMVSGDSTNLSLPAFTAGTSPTRPVTPSITLTVTKV